MSDENEALKDLGLVIGDIAKAKTAHAMPPEEVDTLDDEDPAADDAEEETP